LYCLSSMYLCRHWCCLLASSLQVKEGDIKVTEGGPGQMHSPASLAVQVGTLCSALFWQCIS
jgi:hypothetical protein